MNADFFEDGDDAPFHFNHEETEIRKATIGMSITQSQMGWPHINIRSEGISGVTDGAQPEFEMVAMLHEEPDQLVKALQPLLNGIAEGKIRLIDGAQFGGTRILPRRMLVKAMPNEENLVRIIIADPDNNIDPETMDPAYRYQFELNSYGVDAVPIAELIKSFKGGDRKRAEELMKNLKSSIKNFDERVDNGRKVKKVVDKIIESLDRDILLKMLLSTLIAQSVVIKKTTALLRELAPKKHTEMMEDASFENSVIKEFEARFMALKELFKDEDSTSE